MPAVRSRILMINSLDERYGSTYRMRALRDQLKRAGYWIVYWEGRGGAFRRLREAVGQAQREVFDTLYAQKFNPITLTAIAVARFRRKKVVVDWDDFDVGLQSHWLKRCLAAFCEAIGPSCVDRISTHSSEIAERATRLSVPVTMVGQGFDDELFRFHPDARRKARERLGVPYGTYLIGHLCTFTSGGALDLQTILEAWAKVESREFRFVLIGGGPLEQEIRERIDRLGLRERVILTGLLPHEEVPETLAALDLGVVWMSDTPANRARVSFKVIEYLAMDVPVLGKVVGETERLFGHLIESCDHETLSSAMQAQKGKGNSRTTLDAVRPYRWNVIGEKLGERLCL